MIKALKKLKNWQRKKKRRKSDVFQPHSSPHCCACGASSPLQPTAPPLPPWLYFDHQQDETASGSDPAACTFPTLPPWLDFDHQQDATASGSADPACTFPTQQQLQLQLPDAASEITPLYVPPPLPIATSYQQYLAPSPVYGVPVSPVNPERRTRGLFGCVVSVCSYLIRCLCPCIQFHHSLN